MFDRDPVDPAGEGTRRADNPRCCGPGVVGVGVAREFVLVLQLLLSEFASSTLPQLVVS